MTTDNPTEVLCLDCKTPVKTAVSRARRIGEGCWRKRRAAARAQRALVALPGLGPRAAAQTGPGLLDDVDAAEDLSEDGPR
ncbi:hypothetical protein ACGF7U_31285 [Micromonospora sp. NPDC047670]|uniref:hypothetical protein n=1 Tax=Micromonospora sp. NPDC047670 TaxID=3364252 RepID=UPI00371432F6